MEFDKDDLVEHTLKYYNVDEDAFYDVTVTVPRHVSEYIDTLKHTIVQQEIEYEDLFCRYDLITPALSKIKQN